MKISLPLLGLFLVVTMVAGGGLRRIGSDNNLRSCSRTLDESIKLPPYWQIQSCQSGDWSGDFQATLRVPSKSSSQEFWRLNTPVKPEWTLTLDQSREGIDLLEVRMVGPK